MNIYHLVIMQHCRRNKNLDYFIRDCRPTFVTPLPPLKMLPTGCFRSFWLNVFLIFLRHISEQIRTKLKTAKISKNLKYSWKFWAIHLEASDRVPVTNNIHLFTCLYNTIIKLNTNAIDELLKNKIAWVSILFHSI